MRPNLCEGHMDRIFSEYKEVYVIMLCLLPPIPIAIQLFLKNYLVECETAHLHGPWLTILGDVNADLLKKPLCLCLQGRSVLPVIRLL